MWSKWIRKKIKRGDLLEGNENMADGLGILVRWKNHEHELELGMGGVSSRLVGRLSGEEDMQIHSWRISIFNHKGHLKNHVKFILYLEIFRFGDGADCSNNQLVCDNKTRKATGDEKFKELEVQFGCSLILHTSWHFAVVGLSFQQCVI